MKNWCCIQFEQSLEMPGLKGCSIVALNKNVFDCFCIIALPFERDVAKYLFSIDPKTGCNRVPELRSTNGELIPLTAVLFFPLKHCPYCGKELNDLIRLNRNEYDALADKQLPLWKPWE